MSKNCGCGGKVVARGMCKKCYDAWYVKNKNNPDVMFQKSNRGKSKTKSGILYPIPHVITVWECSDGREFSAEVDALRYELELFRNG